AAATCRVTPGGLLLFARMRSTRSAAVESTACAGAMRGRPISAIIANREINLGIQLGKKSRQLSTKRAASRVSTPNASDYADRFTSKHHRTGPPGSLDRTQHSLTATPAVSLTS